jgi:hypothetical protein
MLKLFARCRWCLVLLLLCGGMADAAELVVIVSAKNPLSTMRADQVAAIFLSQSGRFPGGDDAQALDLPLGSPLRDEFYRTVTSRTPALMKAYWTKMVFTGRGHPPRELASSVAARRLVAENPAMIAYIDKAALDSSVKVIQVTP